MAESPAGGAGVSYQDIPAGSTPRLRKGSPAGDLQLPSIGGTTAHNASNVEEMLMVLDSSLKDSGVDEVKKLPQALVDFCEQESSAGSSGGRERLFSTESITSKMSTDDGRSFHGRKSMESARDVVQLSLVEFDAKLPEMLAQDPASGGPHNSGRLPNKKLAQGRRSSRRAATHDNFHSSRAATQEELRSSSKPNTVQEKEGAKSTPRWSQTFKRPTNVVGASFFSDAPPVPTPLARRSTRKLDAPNDGAAAETEQPNMHDETATLESALSMIAQPREIAPDPDVLTASKSESKPVQNTEVVKSSASSKCSVASLEVCMLAMPALPASDSSPRNRMSSKKKSELASRAAAANTALDRVPSKRSQTGLGIVGVQIAKDGPGGKELADMWRRTSSGPAMPLTCPQGNVIDVSSISQVQAPTAPKPAGRRKSFPAWIRQLA